MAKMIEVLKKMPIYPHGMKLGKNQNLNFPPDVPICESDDHVFSWISQKAKDEYLDDYRWKSPHKWGSYRK